MTLDPELLARLRETKAKIDELQDQLKAIVDEMRAQGASAQEIGEAIRGSGPPPSGG